LLVRSPGHEALAQLEGGFEVDGLHRADATGARELGLSRATDPIEPTMARNELPCHVEHVMRLRTGAENDGDELVVR
jgi:hypothetical protein